MALAEGKSSFKTGPITLHTQTAIHIAETLTNVRLTIMPSLIIFIIGLFCQLSYYSFYVVLSKILWSFSR